MESLPEFVLVPARTGPAGIEMETRHTIDGPDLVLPAFSSVASLVGMLGHEQPWICVSLRDAAEAATLAGLARVVIDPKTMADTDTVTGPGTGTGPGTIAGTGTMAGPGTIADTGMTAG